MLEVIAKGLTARGVLQGDSTPGPRGLFPSDRLPTTYRFVRLPAASYVLASQTPKERYYFVGSGSSTSRTKLSRSAQATRNCRSVALVAPKSWNSPIDIPSES
jgi:hypothetical protein